MRACAYVHVCVCVFVCIVCVHVVFFVCVLWCLEHNFFGFVQALSDCRDDIISKLELDAASADELELSMGMSGDYEMAVSSWCSLQVNCLPNACVVIVSGIACLTQIEYGSTNVRVGSSIFGARAPKV